MATPLNTIKNWFLTGLKPTQAQFWATWDSFWHKDEDIPQESIEGLQSALDAKADVEALNGKTDKGGYNGTAQDIVDLIPQVEGVYQPVSEKAQANGYASLDGSGKIPTEQLPEYVDDAIEGYYDEGVFYEDAGLSTAIVPTTGKIYVDITGNPAKSYRWSGSVYIEISNVDIAKVKELYQGALAGSDTKATPVDADIFGYLDSADSNTLKKWTWTNIKTALTAFFNTVYATIAEARKEYLIVAASDETSDLAVATGVITFRMPYGMTLSELRASVKEAPTGSTLIVDVKKNGTTILSTLLSIDSAAKTSVTAATPVVISTSNLPDDDEVTADITQVGATTPGKGLKLTLIGTRTT